MTLSFWQRNDREADADCDVAVVGGGIIGCATAYWLRRFRPALRVALVEGGRLASGASGRNAGFLLQGAAFDYVTDRERYGAERARRLWHFTRQNRDLIASELRPRVFALEASGSLAVAGTEAEDARLRAAVRWMRADGAPVAYIPPEETNRRLVGRGFYGALYVPSGAALHPARLVRHLAATSGAAVYEQHRVVALDEAGGRYVLETPVRRLWAGQVVLALGAYLPLLVPELGRYVRPVRAQMLATVPRPPRWLQLPAYTHDGYFYLRQTPDGTLLAGGARHLHADAEVGYEDATTPALQADLEAYLHHHFPQTQGLAVRHRWSGTMGFSPDHLPVVGAVPGLPGCHWAAGFTGHGMGYGFRFGQLLAEHVLGRPHPEDFDLFTADRFERARPTRLRTASDAPAS
ncbi:MAG: FAD-binding oxidoreductase [Rhodothermales bacterium]|nr:FAD-binding oxidoreductase [Rhodothermales bacterium]